MSQIARQEMNNDPERTLNQTTFRRLQATIDQTYPKGRFVAISGGQIVADASSLDEIQAEMLTQGKDPTRVLVVQVGGYYPESAIIL